VAWVFIDGCMAVTCTNCKACFCAFCGAIGKDNEDAHRLVNACPLNPEPGHPFCTMEKYRQVRNRLYVERFHALVRGFATEEFRQAFLDDATVKGWKRDLRIR
jgi:hypothetical protein